MQELPTLSLVQALCKALDAEEVAYCHWKSTATLDRSATGDLDLDLLVDRRDVGRFTEILHRLRFKQALPPPARRLPGMVHYYGYDEEADRFVHVDAHYQLIVGDDMTKNYRVPIESVFIESAVQQGPFKIPSPEFEFIVFVIRMILKYSPRDAALRLHRSLPTAERRELEYLQARIDQVKVAQLLGEHLPWLREALLDRCVASFRPGCPVWTRVRVADALRRALTGHARRPQILDVYLRQWRRVRRALGWLRTRRAPRKRLASGGALIALVGGDGAGKSTAVAEIHAWLSQDFETMKVHLGKPPESPLSLGVAIVLRIRRWFEAQAKRTRQPEPAAERSVFPGYLWLLRRVGVARCRHRAYARARRFATNGGLAICDRYPIPGIKLMDGPQCAEMLRAAPRSRLIEFLAGKEEEYYRWIMPPDLLVVLRLDPEIAVRRRRDEAPAAVRARNREVWEFDWGGTHALVVDASRSRSEVIFHLKSLIWASL